MRPPALSSRPEPSETAIQEAAYFLWVELGRPAGRDLEMWLAAKEMLRHTHTGPSRAIARAPRRGVRVRT